MSDEQPVRRRAQSGTANTAAVQKEYQPYVDADWGFVNHWYPALFSNELAEGEVEGIQIAGIKLCSDEPTARSTRSRISASTGSAFVCETHVLQQRDDLLLVSRIHLQLGVGQSRYHRGQPHDPLIGNTGLTTYPVQEAAGLIFVFVRRMTFRTRMCLK